MSRDLHGSRCRCDCLVVALVAASVETATMLPAAAQVVVGGNMVVIQRFQFGGGFGGGPMGRMGRPVDEGSGLFADDDFRRIGDPWWDDVAKDEGANALPAVGRQPAAGVPAGANVGDGDPKLDAAALSREQRDALAVESSRLAAVTGMMTLRRELSAVRQLRPMLDEQQRSFVLAAGKKAVRERLTALDEKPLTRWTTEQKQALAASIREAIAGALAANDSDEARDAYGAETTRREERRKRAAIDALVAELDRELQLNGDERTRLVTGLTEAYREAWRTAADAYPLGLSAGVGMQQLPTGLDRSVERILGKQRTAEWLARRPANGMRPNVNIRVNGVPVPLPPPVEEVE